MVCHKHKKDPVKGYNECPGCEIEQLLLAEEGAKEAFGHVVQQKRDLEKECKRLRGLLDGAYETIRRQAHNARSEARPASGTSRSTEELDGE